MKNNSVLQKNIILVLSLLSVILFLTFIKSQEKNTLIDDTSVIIGGKVETGYIFAGYLLSSIGNNRLNICGGVFLNASTFLTAAHCVHKTNSVVIGVGEYSPDTSRHIPVDKILIHPLWSNSQQNNQSTHDIAVLKIPTTTNIRDFAVIAPAQIGCDYEVVGYGRVSSGNDIQSADVIRERKSAEICIDQISTETMTISGVDGGFCFGDSGGPIFEKNSNRLVGIMSAAELDETGNCLRNNRGIAVTASMYSSFISERATDISLEICPDLDINSDGRINILDFSNFVRRYNSQCINSGSYSSCGSIDQNNDSKVDILDFSAFIGKYGNICR